MTEDHELEQMHALACYAFNSTQTPSQKEAYKQVHRHSHNYGIVTDDGLQSQVVSYPFTVMIHGVPMKMSGIGDVSTYPEARGQGGVRQLLTHIFEELHEQHVPLSYLSPFSQPFYRQFGYERVFEGHEVIIPKEIMSDFPVETAGRVMRTSIGEEGILAIMSDLYGQTQGQEHGSLVRETWWTTYKHESRERYLVAIVVDDEDVPRGYVVYELGDTVFHIRELVYINYFGLAKLLTFIGSHVSSFETFESTNIIDDSWLTLLPDTASIIRKQSDYMMARIVDMVSFIEQYPFKDIPEVGQMTIRVKDDQCPWNDEIFQLSVKRGRAHCVPVSKVSKTHYEGSIQTFTQVFMNSITVSEAKRYGRLSHQGDELLSTLLHKASPCLYDYF